MEHSLHLHFGPNQFLINFLNIDNEVVALISSGKELQICGPTDFRLLSP